jgi:hypothetical protein
MDYRHGARPRHECPDLGYNPLMQIRDYVFLAGVIVVAASFGCSPNSGELGNSTPPAQGTPSKQFTSADVAKLKWIEGTWRGMDDDKPFYERYRIENDTALVVETLKEDGSVDGEPDRFELKNGEFGNGEGDKRSAASEITADYVQFVPAVPGKGNNFRFHRQPDGTWHALLEWPASGDKPARQKTYIMEPGQKPAR